MDFVEEPADDCFCPICTELLTEPFLTDCGHHLCRNCRDRLLVNRKDDCPVCREPAAVRNARLNMHHQRYVKGVQVRCKYKEEGCKWVGELQYIEEHLQVVDSTAECGFIPLSCPYGCGERVLSSAIRDHVKHNCMYKCEHCEYYNTREIVTERHYQICELYPMKCPNKCGIENLKRNQLTKHHEQCPLEVISCPFESVGCFIKLPRRDMDEHEQTDMSKHLRMMMSLHVAKPKQKPAGLPTYDEGESELLFNLPPVTFAVRDFIKLKDHNAEWVSLPFYTHPHGYRLCLVVYPNGIESGKGTHMSVFVGLMEGNYDDQLKWPVEIDVSIELLNWKEDKGHYEQTVTVNSDYYRVAQTQSGIIKISPCEVQFIHHSVLCSKFLQHAFDSSAIQFKVKIPNVMVTIPIVKLGSSWKSPEDISQPVCEFTLTDFLKRKQFNNQFYSPSFLTHENGYKLCLRIHANGYRSGRNSHLSVYVQLMAGNNDDQLKWPFEGDIVFEILNWSADENHYKDTVSISPILNFVQVNHKGTVGESFGYYETILLPACSKYDFLDSLRFRVSEVATYSSPLVVKTPSWEESGNNRLSTCAFTLTEFSKRKLFGNKFYSPPFYSHAPAWV